MYEALTTASIAVNFFSDCGPCVSGGFHIQIRTQYHTHIQRAYFTSPYAMCAAAPHDECNEIESEKLLSDEFDGWKNRTHSS